MSAEGNRSIRKLPLVIILMLATVCAFAQTAPTESANLLGDSVGEFSNEQGKGGWFYGYWDSAQDSDREYNPASDFKLFERFGKDDLNGLSTHSNFTTGDLWYLEDGRYYTSLWAKGGHANSSVRLGNHAAAEHWAVRRWISDTHGTITIAGQAGKEMPWGRNWGGECKAIIVVDGAIVLSTVMDEHPVDYSVAVKVKEKSVVDFLIGPDPSIGVVTFTATLHKRP